MYKVGMKISEKLSSSDERFRKEGHIKYVFNDYGLIYRETGSTKDTFILTKGRDIKEM